MDEFALCWNNFQDNIATGFQDLFDRGDLVDITIAVEGRIIQAHKVVLAICSPYFQEIFKFNPHKHPIIILKDVSYSVMMELLQFMYQGEVNVKHTELQAFMKIAEMLQIKGLTTPNQKLSSPLVHRTSGRQTPTHPKNSETPPIQEAKNSGNGIPVFGQLPVPRSLDGAGSSQKRLNDIATDSYSMIYAKKLPKRSVSETNDSSGTHDMTNDSMENMTDEVFMPQISMGEQRFDLNNVKRENPDMPNSPQQRSAANSSNASFNYDYQNNSGPSFNNDLNASNDFNNSKGSHMDIPAGGNITMLSSTSLLHGNCIFNRNNTVATQQGMKTYWLCKSYRITMCRARCITHQGRVISATGVHNHSPHMKNPAQNENCVNPNQPPPQPIVITSTAAITPVTSSQTIRLVSQNISSGSSISSLGQNQSQPPHIVHQNTAHLQPPPPLPGSHPMQHMPLHQPQVSQHMNHIIGSQPITATPVSVQQQPTAVIQNMMQNVLTSNNLMHQHHLATSIHGLTNIGPILNPLQHQHHVLTNIHPPPSLQITPVINAHIQSPVRAILPPQHQQPPPESPHTPHNHSSTPSSTVVIQTNPTITQSGTTHQTEDSSRHQQNDSSQLQDSVQDAQQTQASNQQISMQSIEMSHSHGTPNFKMEHI